MENLKSLKDNLKVLKIDEVHNPPLNKRIPKKSYCNFDLGEKYTKLKHPKKRTSGNSELAKKIEVLTNRNKKIKELYSAEISDPTSNKETSESTDTFQHFIFDPKETKKVRKHKSRSAERNRREFVDAFNQTKELHDLLIKEENLDISKESINKFDNSNIIRRSKSNDTPKSSKDLLNKLEQTQNNLKEKRLNKSTICKTCQGEIITDDLRRSTDNKRKFKKHNIENDPENKEIITVFKNQNSINISDSLEANEESLFGKIKEEEKESSKKVLQHKRKLREKPNQSKDIKCNDQNKVEIKTKRTEANSTILVNGRNSISTNCSLETIDRKVLQDSIPSENSGQNFVVIKRNIKKPNRLKEDQNNVAQCLKIDRKELSFSKLNLNSVEELYTKPQNISPNVSLKGKVRSRSVLPPAPKQERIQRNRSCEPDIDKFKIKEIVAAFEKRKSEKKLIEKMKSVNNLIDNTKINKKQIETKEESNNFLKNKDIFAELENLNEFREKMKNQFKTNTKFHTSKIREPTNRIVEISSKVQHDEKISFTVEGNEPPKKLLPPYNKIKNSKINPKLQIQLFKGIEICNSNLQDFSHGRISSYSKINFIQSKDVSEDSLESTCSSLHSNHSRRSRATIRRDWFKKRQDNAKKIDIGISFKPQSRQHISRHISTQTIISTKDISYFVANSINSPVTNYLSIFEPLSVSETIMKRDACVGTKLSFGNCTCCKTSNVEIISSNALNLTSDFNNLKSASTSVSDTTLQRLNELIKEKSVSRNESQNPENFPNKNIESKLNNDTLHCKLPCSKSCCTLESIQKISTNAKGTSASSESNLNSQTIKKLQPVKRVYDKSKIPRLQKATKDIRSKQLFDLNQNNEGENSNITLNKENREKNIASIEKYLSDVIEKLSNFNKQVSQKADDESKNYTTEDESNISTPIEETDTSISQKSKLEKDTSDSDMKPRKSFSFTKYVSKFHKSSKKHKSENEEKNLKPNQFLKNVYQNKKEFFSSGTSISTISVEDKYKSKPLKFRLSRSQSPLRIEGRYKKTLKVKNKSLKFRKYQNTEYKRIFKETSAVCSCNDLIQSLSSTCTINNTQLLKNRRKPGQNFKIVLDKQIMNKEPFFINNKASNDQNTSTDSLEKESNCKNILGPLTAIFNVEPPSHAYFVYNLELEKLKPCANLEKVSSKESQFTQSTAATTINEQLTESRTQTSGFFDSQSCLKEKIDGATNINRSTFCDIGRKCENIKFRTLSPEKKTTKETSDSVFVRKFYQNNSNIPNEGIDGKKDSFKKFFRKVTNLLDLFKTSKARCVESSKIILENLEESANSTKLITKSETHANKTVLWFNFIKKKETQTITNKKVELDSKDKGSRSSKPPEKHYEESKMSSQNVLNNLKPEETLSKVVLMNKCKSMDNLAVFPSKQNSCNVKPSNKKFNPPLPNEEFYELFENYKNQNKITKDVEMKKMELVKEIEVPKIFEGNMENRMRYSVKPKLNVQNPDKVLPDDIGRCFAGGFRTNNLLLSGEASFVLNKQDKKKLPETLPSSAKSMVDFSKRRAPLDFLRNLGFVVNEPSDALKDKDIRSRLLAAIAEFEDKDNKEEVLKKQLKNLFVTVYVIAEREAKLKKQSLTKRQIDLLKILSARYREFLQPHLDLLARYIGLGLLRTEIQLQAAIMFLSRMKTTEVKLKEFEAYCGISCEDLYYSGLQNRN